MTPRLVHRPSKGDAPFGIDEILVSRTDRRGMIVAGNEPFRRIAHDDWETLLGAPHSALRHPEMPRGLFQLIWDNLKADKPVGAYIKNKTSDGLPCWVYAIMIPVDRGYLSVAIKPLTKHLNTVVSEYAGLLQTETQEDLDPSASAKAWAERIGKLGFSGYNAFMSHCLADEVALRAAKLERSEDPRIQKFLTMTNAIGTVQQETVELSKTFSAIRGIPFNMRILASRLEAAGGPIGVISANYGTLSREIGTWVQNFITDSDSAFETIRTAIDNGLFLLCTAAIQKDAMRRTRSETSGTDRIDSAAEAQLLADQSAICERRAMDGLSNILAQSERFNQAVKDMRRQITGLSTTRMMCKIESARLPGEGDSLAEIIRQLDAFQSTIEDSLGRIDDQNRTIQACASVMSTKLPGTSQGRSERRAS